MSTKKLYCNPLPIPYIPRGKDEWYKTERAMFSHENKPDYVKTPDYRSISDPTVFYYDNKWYLYPSYGMAWVSEDFVNWKHYKTEPYCPKYSPTIIPYKGKFLLTAWFCPLYEADSPLGPFKELGNFIMPDGSEFTPCDPGIFIDDDNRIFLYAFDEIDGKTCIVGYELSYDNPRKVIGEKQVIFTMQPEKHWWERRGKHKQDFTYGWVEGPHMLKYQGRYYLIYASSDTRDSSYCLAVYYSDKPLEGFVCQKRNPLSFNMLGIVAGAGHGCVEKGPNDTLWCFYTIPTPYTHWYERRIGMDRVCVDKNGELYCPLGVTDTPQFSPCLNQGVKNKGKSPKLFNLTGGCRPIASSEKEGRDAIYATDESNITWWQPEDGDNTPTLLCDLEREYSVQAVRIFFKEIGLDYEKGIVPHKIKYRIYGLRGDKKFLLYDCTKGDEEKNIEFNVFTPKICDKVELQLLNKIDLLKIGIIDFAVFGKITGK